MMTSSHPHSIYYYYRFYGACSGLSMALALAFSPSSSDVSLLSLTGSLLQLSLSVGIMEEHLVSSPQVWNQTKVIIGHKCLKQKQSHMPIKLSL